MSAFLHKLGETIVLAVPMAIVSGAILKAVELLQNRYWHPDDRATPEENREERWT